MSGDEVAKRLFNWFTHCAKRGAIYEIEVVRCFLRVNQFFASWPAT